MREVMLTPQIDIPEIVREVRTRNRIPFAERQRGMGFVHVNVDNRGESHILRESDLERGIAWDQIVGSIIVWNHFGHVWAVHSGFDTRLELTQSKAVINQVGRLLERSSARVLTALRSVGIQAISSDEYWALTRRTKQARRGR